MAVDLLKSHAETAIWALEAQMTERLRSLGDRFEKDLSGILVGAVRRRALRAISELEGTLMERTREAEQDFYIEVAPIVRAIPKQSVLKAPVVKKLQAPPRPVLLKADLPPSPAPSPPSVPPPRPAPIVRPPIPMPPPPAKAFPKPLLHLDPVPPPPPPPPSPLPSLKKSEEPELTRLDDAKFQIAKISKQIKQMTEERAGNQKEIEEHQSKLSFLSEQAQGTNPYESQKAQKELRRRKGLVKFLEGKNERLDRVIKERKEDYKKYAGILRKAGIAPEAFLPPQEQASEKAPVKKAVPTSREELLARKEEILKRLVEERAKLSPGIIERIKEIDDLVLKLEVKLQSPHMLRAEAALVSQTEKNVISPEDYKKRIEETILTLRREQKNLRLQLRPLVELNQGLQALKAEILALEQGMPVLTPAKRTQEAKRMASERDEMTARRIEALEHSIVLEKAELEKCKTRLKKAHYLNRGRRQAEIDAAQHIIDAKEAELRSLINAVV